MIKENHDKAQGDAWKAAGQAAVELAVFGAILIFILGTIIRSSVGNSYAQNQNYKAMRMALLASWNGSKTLNFSTGTDPNAPSPNISRNTASILFVEDRISPDFNKYGGMDRNPFIAQGSGSFSYSLMYPLDAGEVSANYGYFYQWPAFSIDHGILCEVKNDTAPKLRGQCEGTISFCHPNNLPGRLYPASR